MIPVHRYLGQRAGEAKTRGGLLELENALPVVVAMVSCCRDKLLTGGWKPALLFVKDKWKSWGTETAETERGSCSGFFFFCLFDSWTNSFIKKKKTLSSSKHHPAPLNAGIPIDDAPLVTEALSLLFCGSLSSLPNIKARLAVHRLL